MEMPETEDGTQGLPKNLPLWSILHPHTGRRGVLGVLMPETEMARRGLPTNPPLQGRAHLRFAPGRGCGRPARVRAGGARTS